MIAYESPYSLIVALAFVIVLAAALALGIKYSSAKRILGALLFFAGFFEVGFSFFFFFGWGVLLGLVTAVVGFSLFVLFSPVIHEKIVSAGISPAKLKSRKLKKAAYILLAATILASAILIAARATNLTPEQHLAVYFGGSTPNLTVKGTLSSITLNHEVNNGFSYLILPAYLTVNVSEVIWSDQFWENQSIAVDDLQRQGSLVVYFEKTDVPSLAVGQQVEVSGYYSSWVEDSLYSYTLVVSSNVNGSYFIGL